MSITIVAVAAPIVIPHLFAIVGAMASTSALTAIASSNLKEKNHEKWMEKYYNYNKTEVRQEISKHICKEYDTVYVDRDLLVKTLEEHGVLNLHVYGDTITCKSDDYNLKFYRENNEPFVLEVTCPIDEDNFENAMSDLDSEYAQNVQESTYLKIKERLSKHNLQIDNEEILDDDSIMLTINLD